MPLAASNWFVCWIACWSVSICWSVLTSVNCAVCVRNCVLSVGDNGSWYCICATRSCKNVSSLSWLLSFVPVDDGSAVDVAEVVGVVGVVMGGMAVIVCSWSSHAHVEQRRRIGVEGWRPDDRWRGIVGGHTGAAGRRGRGGVGAVTRAVAHATVRHGERAGVDALGVEPVAQLTERVAQHLCRAFA